MWDTAKQGDLERLREQVNLKDQKTKACFADDKTAWLENTPLHLAVRFKQPAIVKVLMLEMGADASLPNAKGLSSLDYAAKISHEAT